jgi:hypothetical protein
VHNYTQCLIPITKEKQYNKACCVIIFSGDSMAHHNGRKCSAKDKDVDAGSRNCAQTYKSDPLDCAILHEHL